MPKLTAHGLSGTVRQTEVLAGCERVQGKTSQLQAHQGPKQVLRSNPCGIFWGDGQQDSPSSWQRGNFPWLLAAIEIDLISVRGWRAEMGRRGYWLGVRCFG